MKTICVIGNFSGRNAGDAAILGGLLHDIAARYPDCQFLVPTINTGFVARSYADYRVKPMGMLPWNLSIKIFGLPIIRAILQADLVLVTDAILFDYRLWNPLYNYLSTMALVLPLAKKKGIPVVLYCVNLGPVYTRAGAVCMNRVLKSADLVLMRDRESQSLLEQLAYHPPAGQVFETADCALNTVPSDQTRLRTILQKEGICQDSKPWVSFNLSSYIDVYVRAYKGKGIGKDNFLAIMAETIDRTMENLGVRVVLVITQPMDLTIAGEMLEKSCHRASIPLISNREYSYQDICAVFSAMTLHVGMRTHSLILASSVFTPVLGIIATPKNRGYMCSIDQQRRMVEFDNFTADSFARAVQDAWENRETIRAELRQSVAREKQKASGAADHLRPFLSAN